MNVPLIQFAIYPLAAICFIVGMRLSVWRWKLIPFAFIALLYALYYLKLRGFSENIGLFELRTVPYSELLAALAGVPAGAFYASLKVSRRWVIPVALCLLLCIPYVKFWVVPLKQSILKETWEKGVCLQSTPSTCGPASAATLCRAQDMPRITERELALDSYSTATGTEIWYLARALQRRGVRTTYLFTGKTPSKLEYPAIAGTKLGGAGGAGHFIAVLDKVHEGYVIADPITGKSILPFNEVRGGRYYFTGFFMELKAPPIRF